MLEQETREIQERALWLHTRYADENNILPASSPDTERAAPQSRLCLAHQVTQRELCLGASAAERGGGAAAAASVLYSTHSQGRPVHSNWKKVLEFRVR